MELSKYTTELRYICETESGLDSSVGYNDIGTVIQEAIPKIFSFDFPIFDNSYRNVLCTKILMHYYTREIGEETYGLWKLRLQTKLNEIMPYYNQMYESQLLKFNPLYDVDMTTDHTGSGTGENTVTETDTENGITDRVSNEEIDIAKDGSNNQTDSETNTDVSNTSSSATENGTSTGTNTELDLYSDTPQGGIDNVENANYLTNIRKKTGSQSGTTTSEGSSEVDYNDTLQKDASKVGTYEDSEKHSKDGTDKITTDIEKNKDTIGNSKSTEEYITKVAGKSGGVSYSKMLNEFRGTFLNIDMSIIDELANIFMNVW